MHSDAHYFPCGIKSISLIFKSYIWNEQNHMFLISHKGYFQTIFMAIYDLTHCCQAQAQSPTAEPDFLHWPSTKFHLYWCALYLESKGLG